MKTDFSVLSIRELREMYQKADSALKAALLAGADWTEVRDKRALVTELSIQLHKKDSL